jgi:hypothetical protein
LQTMKIILTVFTDLISTARPSLTSGIPYQSGSHSFDPLLYFLTLVNWNAPLASLCIGQVFMKPLLGIVRSLLDSVVDGGT